MCAALYHILILNQQKRHLMKLRDTKDTSLVLLILTSFQDAKKVYDMVGAVEKDKVKYE